MFSTLYLYILIAVIIVLALYLIFFRGKKSEKTREELEADSQNYEKEFFARIEKGEKSVLFLTLGNSGDLNLIRSMLYADEVPSYAEGEHMNNIYGGISGTMESVVAVKLYVLEADYERAKEIFENSNIKKGDISIVSKE